VSSPVYSTRFIGITLEAASVAYVVPAGYVAVIKCISLVYVGGPTPANGLVRAGGTNVPLVWLYNEKGHDQVVVNGSWVVDAGESITFDVSPTNALSGYVSGYLLTLP